jgi:hypothetical protein
MQTMSLRSVALQPGLSVRVVAAVLRPDGSEAALFDGVPAVAAAAGAQGRREALELAARCVLSMTNSVPATFLWVASALVHARHLLE